MIYRLLLSKIIGTKAFNSRSFLLLFKPNSLKVLVDGSGYEGEAVILVYLSKH